MTKKLLALYGLKYNPFSQDVPASALSLTPVRIPGETGQDSEANRTGFRFETGQDSGMKPDKDPGNNRTVVREPGMLSGMGRNVSPWGGSTLDERAKGSPVERRSSWPERSDPCVRFNECCSFVLSTG